MVGKFDPIDLPEGISYQQMKIKPGDYVVVKVDQNKFDISEASQIIQTYSKVFPKECAILLTFNGIDIVNIIEREGNL